MTSANILFPHNSKPSDAARIAPFAEGDSLTHIFYTTMSNIEQKISSIEYLTQIQRATLRQMIGYTIYDINTTLSKVAPDWIDPNDYAPIRRLAIEEAYKRRVAGQTWVAGKDKAFKESQGAAKSGSVILTHKFL